MKAINDTNYYPEGFEQPPSIFSFIFLMGAAGCTGAILLSGIRGQPELMIAGMIGMAAMFVTGVTTMVIES